MREWNYTKTHRNNFSTLKELAFEGIIGRNGNEGMAEPGPIFQKSSRERLVPDYGGL